MEHLNVVLFQNDAGAAKALAISLSRHPASIHQARTPEELPMVIARHRADVLVLDLEKSGLHQVERLHHDFPNLSIVCTHRLADEELWTEALNQGAVDMCVPWDTQEIVRSVLREQALHAAA